MAKKKAVEFDVLSPDGFSINREGTYKTKELALAGFAEWSKRFLQQGYYSSNNGRIPLDELAEHCRIVEV